MPNINFDIFYDTDTINITASRGTNAPRAKPSWKIRQAPKLPPREPPQPPAAKAFGPKSTTQQSTASAGSAATNPPPPSSAPKLNQASGSTPASKPEEKAPAAKPKRKAPKLEVRNKKAAAADTADQEQDENSDTS
jgi:hypothetical protein